MPKRKIQQTELLRVLAIRGETAASLAKRCGLNIRTVYNLACGANKTRKARVAVESALGAKIWTREEEAAS